MYKILQGAFLLGALSVCLNVFAGDALRREQIESVLQLTENKKYVDFSGFLGDIRKGMSNQILSRIIEKFQSDKTLAGNENSVIYRLSGIFARHQYKDDMLVLLRKLIAIPTDSLAGINQYENPNIIGFGQAIQEASGELGLDFRNVDNRVFEVVLKGRGNISDSFGIYTHADVVPADARNWILDDGTRLNPYQMQILGDRIYGRGSEDDKGSIVSALFAMKAIEESGLRVNRDIHLIIETTEEIGGSGIRYYQKKYKVPEYNVVLDNLYPVVTAEKGFLLVQANFDVQQASDHGIAVINITGGTTITQIPASSTVTLQVVRPEKTRAQLQVLAEQFIKEHGGNFRIESTTTNDTLRFTVFGVSAHSSTPETGVNPVSRAFVFLSTLMQKMPFRKNHFTDAISYVCDNYGLDFYGKKMGIDYSDEFMGPLTMTLTTVTLNDRKLQIGVSGRPPRGKNVEDLKAEIEQRLKAYRNATGMNFDQVVQVWNYMYRNPDQKWINVLLDIYAATTDDEARPVSSNGGTTAKFLPNAVSFGPCMPGEKYMGHNANEFKRLSNLLLDIQMVTEMILRIGNLDEM